jgi:hypothetical protein
MADMQANSEMSLAAVVDKKKIFVQSKSIVKGKPVILQELLSQGIQAAFDQSMQYVISGTTTIKGIIRVMSSDFTRMPKGFLSFFVADYSTFNTETE